MKFAIAALLDIFEIKPVLATVLLGLSATVAVILTSLSDNAIVYGICVSLNIAGAGSLLSMLPSIAISIFGLKRGPQIYGFLFSHIGMAALLSLLAVNLSDNAMLVCLIFGLISCVLCLCYNFENVYVYAVHGAKTK